MKSNKRPISTPILILLWVAILLGSSLQAHAVSKRMEDPLFWISKIKDPGRLLLTPSDIQKMNEENLKRQDLLLCRAKDMKEEWIGGEILAFLKEDWKEFGKTDQVRYGKQGIPLDDSFWNALKENINQVALKEKNRLLFGLTIERTDVRVFPTAEISISTPTHYEFDLFQHSAIAPGSLVGIYHFSRDNLWAYVQTSFIRGWIRTKDLAMAKGKNDAFGQGEIKEPLVITGNFVRIFADPLFQQPVFSAQMGTTFHILHLPPPSPPRPRTGEAEGGLAGRRSRSRGEGQPARRISSLAGGGEGETDHGHPSPSQRLSLRGRSPSGAEPEPAATLNPPPSRGRIIVDKFSSSKENHSVIGNCYVIKIPFRERDGRLTFRNGYIPVDDDVYYGFLPYTQKNLAQQAFKMLHQPYGWGEMSGGRDCSRFIMDLFNTFGILMPRNSNLQAKMGIPLGALEGTTIEEKKKILDRAVPLATLLRMPGHIMLYLGRHNGEHYAIHSIWGIHNGGKSGPVYKKIGKVAVTDLNLGKGGPNGSLLHRLTEIHLIGPGSEVNK